MADRLGSEPSTSLRLLRGPSAKASLPVRVLQQDGERALRGLGDAVREAGVQVNSVMTAGLPTKADVQA